jgi:hypothetical protein
MSQKLETRKRQRTTYWLDESQTSKYIREESYDRSSGHERNNFFGRGGRNTSQGKYEEAMEKLIPNEYIDEGDNFLVNDEDNIDGNYIPGDNDVSNLSDESSNEDDEVSDLDDEASYEDDEVSDLDDEASDDDNKELTWDTSGNKEYKPR